MPHSQLVPQYLSYWYTVVKNCLRTRPLLPQCQYSDTQQSAIVSVPDLLIRHSPLVPQYLSFWYRAVHHCLSIRPVDTTVYYCFSTSTIDTLQYTTAPLPVLLIRYSPSQTQYQSYWYATVHFCSSTSTTDNLQSTTVPLPTLLKPSISAQVSVLLIRYNPSNNYMLIRYSPVLP